MIQDILNSYQFISSLKNIHNTYIRLSLIKIQSLIQLKNARINGKHPHFSHSSSCASCTLCLPKSVHQANVRFFQYSNAYRRTCPLSPSKGVHVCHANVYTFAQQTSAVLHQANRLVYLSKKRENTLDLRHEN